GGKRRRDQGKSLAGLSLDALKPNRACKHRIFKNRRLGSSGQGHVRGFNATLVGRKSAPWVTPGLDQTRQRRAGKAGAVIGFQRRRQRTGKGGGSRLGGRPPRPPV